MMTKEKIEHYIEQLKEKHIHIHKMIEAAESEKAPDEYVKRLKKDKLQLKDDIQFNQKRLEKM